jgi:hypothetical protein
VSDAPLVFVGVGEAAAILGVSKQRVFQLRKANLDFPEPYQVLAATPIWTLRDVERFARTRRTKPGPQPRALLVTDPTATTGGK